jgi:hypothetical protein
MAEVHLPNTTGSGGTGMPGLGGMVGVRLRVNEVLLGQHPGRQRVGGVAGQHRHHRLRQDGPVVQLGRHPVHRGAGKFAARIDGPLVRVQARKRRQQRGMDVDQPPGVVRTKPGVRMRMNPASTTSAGWWRSITCGQLGVKGLARPVGLVVHHRGGNDPARAPIPGPGHRPCC